MVRLLRLSLEEMDSRSSDEGTGLDELGNSGGIEVANTPGGAGTTVAALVMVDVEPDGISCLHLVLPFLFTESLDTLMFLYSILQLLNSRQAMLCN